ncbi:unnamed protein product [Phytophthora lilii]|uniref:Unnamed protein product n=1 Tax=Phytophthora lilii TaxID=2077276 RepID=A0A9W6X4S2_9STRA|nr:unnamed protein product [Phytophthora lilii]
MGLEELVVTGAYVSGAVCIVLFTLTISWLVVWKCVLAKMPFIQELFDLKPKKPSAHDEKSISFQDRYQAYKRVRRRVSSCALGPLQLKLVVGCVFFIAEAARVEDFLTW